MDMVPRKLIIGVDVGGMCRKVLTLSVTWLIQLFCQAPTQMLFSLTLESPGQKQSSHLTKPPLGRMLQLALKKQFKDCSKMQMFFPNVLRA